MQLSPAPVRVHALIDSLTWGGAEMLLADLAEAAAGGTAICLSVGYLREDVFAEPARARLRAAGIEPALIGTGSLWRFRDLRRVRQHLRDVDPDVVHTHLGYADFLGGLAARSLGIASVSTVHVMDWSGPFRERIKAGLMALVRKYCAERVIAVSGVAREAYLQKGWDRPEHVLVVHNGVAIAPVPGAGRLVRQQLGLAENDVVLGMLSVLRPGKGHDIAAGAVRQLRQEFPRLRLLVVGDGPGRPEVEQSLASLGPAAVLAGHRNDVAAVLDAVDILIHPSRVDAFPTALLEAAALSVPVVATAVGGIPEIVVDGVTGVLVPLPPDVELFVAALRPLLSSPAARVRLGGSAQRRFQQDFTASSWLQRLLPVYRDASGRSATGGSG